MKYSYYEALKELKHMFWHGSINGNEFRDAEFLLFYGEEPDNAFLVWSV